jgi:hypothetical protein
MGFALLCGAALVRTVESSRGTRLIGLGLTLWFVGSSVLAHPDYLAYFNAFAGDEPERVLVDSDLDWGQDIKRLSKRLAELGVKEVSFANLLVADLEGHHGFPRLNKRIDVLRPNPGWNAVGFTFLKANRYGLFESNPGVIPWPERIPPTERVGKSILLWKIPSDESAH